MIRFVLCLVLSFCFIYDHLSIFNFLTPCHSSKKTSFGKGSSSQVSSQIAHSEDQDLYPQTLLHSEYRFCHRAAVISPSERFSHDEAKHVGINPDSYIVKAVPRAQQHMQG